MLQLSASGQNLLSTAFPILVFCQEIPDRDDKLDFGLQNLYGLAPNLDKHIEMGLLVKFIRLNGAEVHRLKLLYYKLGWMETNNKLLASSDCDCEFCLQQTSGRHAHQPKRCHQFGCLRVSSNECRHTTKRGGPPSKKELMQKDPSRESRGQFDRIIKMKTNLVGETGKRPLVEPLNLSKTSAQVPAYHAVSHSQREKVMESRGKKKEILARRRTASNYDSCNQLVIHKKLGRSRSSKASPAPNQHSAKEVDNMEEHEHRNAFLKNV